MINIKEYDQYHEIILENSNLKVNILTYGGIIKTLKYLDRDMILSYDTFNEYVKDDNYVGSIVGRYANRIGNAEFVLDGITYNLSPNDGNNHNHGGFNAFNKSIWDYRIIDNNTVRLHLFSLDDDNGYPGNVDTYVTYQITDNKLLVKFDAKSDKKTIYGPTCHIYFNIDNENNILDTLLSMNATKYLKVNEDNIPTTILDCDGKYDFTSMHKINENFDHCFILEDENAATIRKNDIQINIKTNYPALHLYTGTMLPKSKHGFALEPEFYPDSINHNDWPSPILETNEEFNKYIEYDFSKIKG